MRGGGVSFAARLSVVAGGLLAASAPSQAEFVWDPETDPVDLVCEPEWTPEECRWEKQFEAWHRKYGDDYDLWHQWLLFMPDVYFAKPHHKLPVLPQLAEDQSISSDTLLSAQTPNLVDAVYQIALRSNIDGWAFAINDDAVLRMVRKKRDEEIDQEVRRAYVRIFPDSIEEVAREIAIEWRFDEVRLPECDGAIVHLREFPAQQGRKFWSDRSIEWLPNAQPREENDWIIVSADGDSIFMRAGSREDEGDPRKIIGRAFITYDQHNGGAGYDWAKQMAKIVEPCLEPSDAMPPWEYLLQGQKGATVQTDAPPDE